MGYYAVTTLPEKTAPLPKNRAGGGSASARVKAVAFLIKQPASLPTLHTP
jgi:hypothetical protein